VSVLRRLLRRPRFLIVDGCPCPYDVAAQIHVVLRSAGQTASSIYRGEDAAALLHRHGKHTQAEIHRMFPAISNPPGRSQHELRSDGSADKGPPGRHLRPWRVGVDSGTNDHAAKDRVTAAAREHGWTVEHPYSRGVEGHHWAFKRRPRARNPRQAWRLIKLRRRLPRR
jgi:hypothetical protein